MRIFLMTFVVAVLIAVWVPSAQAFLLNGTVVDNYDTVLLPVDGTQWHDERGAGYLEQNTAPENYVLEGTGSMEMNYGLDGVGYDRVPRRYNIPALVSTDVVEFWWRKGNIDGSGPECVREMIFYSPGGGVARLAVANGETTYVGWQHVSAPISSFVSTGDIPIDWAHVDAVDYWMSSWGYVGPWGEPGSYQIMPTGASVFVDVPEPVTMVMLGLGGLAMLKRRKA
ncbi:MAG: PEP-CTERM sorting domain-containing protein [Planctomycetota bacterium]|nr:PEP-CTERM sorting domain-containing protein [Planctomycetota bacterium]